MYICIYVYVYVSYINCYYHTRALTWGDDYSNMCNLAQSDVAVLSICCVSDRHEKG